MPRNSLRRHPVAVLRKTIDLGQKQLAALCGCTTSAIQKVENLELMLSTRIAKPLVAATGVSFDWLMRGDPSSPIKSMGGRPYTLATYRRWKRNSAWERMQGAPTPDADDALADLCFHLFVILRSLSRTPWRSKLHRNRSRGWRRPHVSRTIGDALLKFGEWYEVEHSIWNVTPKLLEQFLSSIGTGAKKLMERAERLRDSDRPDPIWDKDWLGKPIQFIKPRKPKRKKSGA